MATVGVKGLNLTTG